MSYAEYRQGGVNPYQGSAAAEAGYGGGTDQHEMTTYSNTPDYSTGAPSAPSASSGSPLTQGQFLDEVKQLKKDIKTFEALIDKYFNASTHMLNSANPVSVEIDGADATINAEFKAITGRIETLKRDVANTHDSSKETKRIQYNSLVRSIKTTKMNYVTKERDHQTAIRDQIKKQVLWVNPKATEQQIEKAQDGKLDNVLITALEQSNRGGEVSTVQKAVNDRHKAITKIGKDITEIARLFDTMEEMVAQQDAVIENTEENTVKGNEHLGKGVVEIVKANASARRRNKLKWYCLLVTILIILAIALGVGLGVGLAVKGSKTATGN